MSYDSTRLIPNTLLERTMTHQSFGKLVDGAFCKVVGGTHAGKSGAVTDIKTSKTGYVTITVVKKDGVRFKTLARNVVVSGKA